MIAKVKAALNGITVNDFIEKVRYIITMIVTSGNFPNLPHPASEIEADTNALAVLQGQVAAGNRINIRSRNELQAAIRRKMTANANYVNGIAMGNAAMLETSGYELVKESVPRGIPSTIAKISTKVLQPLGTVKVSWSASKERDYYLLEKRIGELGAWEEVEIITKTNFTVSGLAYKQDVYFRVAAVNSAGMSVWSDVAVAVVS